MTAVYQSTLSQTLIKRIRGEPDSPRIEVSTHITIFVIYELFYNACHFKFVQNLELTNGFISPFCLHMISKSIVYNNTQNNISGALYDINLGRNILCGVNERGGGDYDPTGLIELLETISPSRCLRTLNLERNYLGVESCRALGDLLGARSPLSNLK